ncbi:MAG: hypothetical protein EOM37_01540 [Proteobacteria bacterium]|nr:hypothetical protein [Pseudomonadota bacterium]
MRDFILRGGFVVICLLFLQQPVWAARDAAFVSPSAGSASGASPDSLKVEPKNEVDVGETPVNLGRRATFFFINQTGQVINIEKISANGDSNVKAEIVGDDCSRTKAIPIASRCSVTVEATPTGSGSWSAELLVTHDAPDRIARVRIIGKTGGNQKERRDLGLSLSTKDIKPIDFGEVEVGTDKAVRTALMVNDSNENISILSVEVIAPENGLERLDQGCLPDMDLKVGESCPVTLMWQPEARGMISTDLIIRHTGQLGFAVIPIRGKAKELVADPSLAGTASGGAGKGAPVKMPDLNAPPTLDDIQREMQGNLSPLSIAGEQAEMVQRRKTKPSEDASLGSYQLIGTVGNRAIIIKPDGSTEIVSLGQDIPEEGGTVKVLNIAPNEATIMRKGKKQTLRLQPSNLMTNRALQQRSGDAREKDSLQTNRKPAHMQEKSSVDLPVKK